MALYLIRHAQSANNAVCDSQRVEDPGITAVGHQQAQRLAARAAALGWSRLLTSAFRRALETADHLRRSTQLRPRVWIELHECGGCYAGHTLETIVGRPGMNGEQIQQGFPHCDLETAIDAGGWWQSRPKETRDQAQSRAARVARRLAEFCRQRPNIPAALVIHADFKAVLLEQMIGPRFAQRSGEPLYNTGVTQLQPMHQHDWDLIEFNDVSHLPEELVTD